MFYNILKEFFVYFYNKVFKKYLDFIYFIRWMIKRENFVKWGRDWLKVIVFYKI